jgi:D-sedoheptulose 7-phosphate isomerase
MADQGKILAVMSDLFFSVKINDAAKKLGTSAEFVKEAERALEKARSKPPLIILDLNSGDPLALIKQIKSDKDAATVPIVGFVSHVQTELRQKAVEAGCDTVVARSVFAQDLSKILEKYVRDRVRAIFEQTAANITALCTSPYLGELSRAVDMLVAAFLSGQKLLVFGNGGSSADAHHICAELVGRFARERRGLPAMALSSDPSILTSLGNDYGFAAIFERQVEAHGKPGDVAWGISTSGNSPNVVRAMKAAKGLGLKTIGLTGASGGEMAQFCDVLMATPLKETPRIQEIHVLTYHAICEAVEAKVFA